jgi:hypothetical protein
MDLTRTPDTDTPPRGPLTPTLSPPPRRLGEGAPDPKSGTDQNSCSDQWFSRPGGVAKMQSWQWFARAHPLLIPPRGRLIGRKRN